MSDLMRLTDESLDLRLRTLQAGRLAWEIARLERERDRRAGR